MNEHHPIDELFRETISEIELSPSDKVWSSLDKKLEQKSHGARKGKYLFSAIAAGALLVASYYFLSDNNTTPAAAESHAIHQPAPTQSVAAITQTPESPKKQATAPQHAITSAKKEKEATSATAQNETKTETRTVATAEPAKEQAAKNEINTIAVTKETPAKKEASDKDIKLVPSYPAEQSPPHATATNQPAKPVVKNDPAEAPAKSETAAAPANGENVIYVPNAFTPNGDGLNDVFLPKAAEEPKEYKLYIFEPSGAMIFYSDDFSKGWDGKVTHNGIETTKEGLYMWKIEVKNSKGEREVRMGYVNLLR